MGRFRHRFCCRKMKGEEGATPLCFAKSGKRVKIACVEGERGLCARMAALGIYPGVEVQLLCSGCGSPCLVKVHGGTVSLGEDISEKILVTPTA